MVARRKLNQSQFKDFRHCLKCDMKKTRCIANKLFDTQRVVGRCAFQMYNKNPENHASGAQFFLTFQIPLALLSQQFTLTTHQIIWILQAELLLSVNITFSLSPQSPVIFLTGFCFTLGEASEILSQNAGISQLLGALFLHMTSC